jgi:hypothetical protein
VSAGPGFPPLSNSDNRNARGRLVELQHPCRQKDSLGVTLTESGNDRCQRPLLKASGLQEAIEPVIALNSSFRDSHGPLQGQ